MFSLLVGAVVRDILTYWLFPHWPRLGFSMARAKTMLSFGLWFSFGMLCEFIAKQLDNLTVGHLLGPGALGNYQMAFRAGEMPVAEFTMSASVVTFPMVARLRNDRRARVRLYWSVIGGGGRGRARIRRDSFSPLATGSFCGYSDQPGFTR